MGHVPALDGLRALAVTAVLLYHSGFSWIRGGFLGVSAFFTLSGFLITSLLLREWDRSEEIDLRAFWTQRARRLLPASWVVLGGVLGLALLGLWSGDQLRQLRSDVPYSLAELVNWHFVVADRSYGASFADPSPVQHYWSLAVEQQFYLVLPLLVCVALVWRRGSDRARRLRQLGTGLAVLALASATLNGLLARTSVDRAYYGTDTRMAELLIGALLAVVMLRRLRIPAARRGLRTGAATCGVLGAVTVLWLWHAAELRSMWMYPWGLLLSALCTAAVLVAALQGGTLARLLSVPPLLRLGRLSYGIYLIHWPVFLLLTPARLELAPLPLLALRLVVTVIAAVVLHHLVEQPVRSGSRLRRPLGLLAAGLSAPLLVAATFAATGDTPAPRFEVAEDHETSPAATVLPRVLVIGDEFATSVGEALERHGDAEVTLATTPRCGLALGGWVATPAGVELDVDRCRAAREQVVRAAERTRPDLVLAVPGRRDVAARRFQATSPWADPSDPGVQDFLVADLVSLVDRLTPSSGAVAFATLPHMRSAEPPTPVPPSILSLAAAGSERDLAGATVARMSEGAPTDFSENDAARIDRLNGTLRQVAAASGAEVVDLGAEIRSWPEGQFDPEMRPDGVRIAGEGARRAGEWLAPRLAGLTPGPTPAPAPPAILDPEATLPPAPAPAPPRQRDPDGRLGVLVVGDSVAGDLAMGLWRLSEEDEGQLDLTNGSLAGCAIARGGSYRYLGDTRPFEDVCDWSGTYPQLVAAHRPDLVLVSSGMWEVADRRFPGDDRFRHLGDAGVDRYVLSEVLTAVDALGAHGAQVVIVLQPHMRPGRNIGLAGLPEGDPGRVDRLNEIYREVARRRPDTVHLIDLGGWLAARGETDDPSVRPDGLHFSEQHSGLVSRWVLGELRSLR